MGGGIASLLFMLRDAWADGKLERETFITGEWTEAFICTLEFVSEQVGVVIHIRVARSGPYQGRFPF
jgi:hypothetical protein